MVLHVKNSSPICMTLCWLWTDTFLTSCSLHCPQSFSLKLSHLFVFEAYFPIKSRFYDLHGINQLQSSWSTACYELWVENPLSQADPVSSPSFCLAFPTGGSSERWGEMLWIRSPTMSYWSEYLSLKQLMCVAVFGSHRMVKNIKWRNLLPN